MYELKPWNSTHCGAVIGPSPYSLKSSHSESKNVVIVHPPVDRSMRKDTLPGAVMQPEAPVPVVEATGVPVHTALLSVTVTVGHHHCGRILRRVAATYMH